MTTLPAQMSNSGGAWHLYIPLTNTPATWPEHIWPHGAVTPTIAERERALNGLGYESAPGAEWDWTEDSDIYGDPTSPVRLIATVSVLPILLGGSR